MILRIQHPAIDVGQLLSMSWSTLPCSWHPAEGWVKWGIGSSNRKGVSDLKRRVEDVIKPLFGVSEYEFCFK